MDCISKNPVMKQAYPHFQPISCRVLLQTKQGRKEDKNKIYINDARSMDSEKDGFIKFVTEFGQCFAYHILFIFNKYLSIIS